MRTIALIILSFIGTNLLSQELISYVLLKRIYEFNAINAENFSKSMISGRSNGLSKELPVFGKLPANLFFDKKGRISSFGGYTSIRYDKNNYISEITFYTGDKYKFVNDSIGNVLRVSSARDTITYIYKANRIIIRSSCLYPCCFKSELFKVDSSKIDIRSIKLDSLGAAFNAKGEVIYLKVKECNYYFHNNRFIKESYTSNYGEWPWNSEKNWVYNQDGNLIFYSYYDDINQIDIIGSLSYDYEDFRAIAKIANNGLYYTKEKYKTIHYLDENKSPIIDETYVNDTLQSWDISLKYYYFKNKQVYSKVHPKHYVKKLHKSLNDTGIVSYVKEIKIHTKLGQLLRIEDARDTNLMKIYHYENDSLYGYTEIDKNKNSTTYYFIMNDSIQFLQSINQKIDIYGSHLSLKKEEIDNSNPVKYIDTNKYKYKLYFSGVQITSNNQQLKLTKEDILKNGFVSISNKAYKIIKLEFDGYSLKDIKFPYIIKSNKFDPKIKQVLTSDQRRFYCKIYIKGKKGEIETVIVSIN